jgi:hypothetical protein
MKRNSILWLVMILTFSLLLTGCGKSTTDLAAEKTIENAFGGDVDVDGDSVTIENDQGTWQAGEGSSLPKDWPDDVYVPEGKIITSSDNNFGKGVSLEVDKTVSELEEEYTNKIKEQGWDVNMSFSVENSVMIGAEKDNKSLSVSIGEEEGKTMIVITLNDKL